MTRVFINGKPERFENLRKYEIKDEEAKRRLLVNVNVKPAEQKGA